MGGSKLFKKFVPYGTILFERLKGLLRKIDPAYAFLKIRGSEKRVIPYFQAPNIYS